MSRLYLFFWLFEHVSECDAVFLLYDNRRVVVLALMNYLDRMSEQSSKQCFLLN